MQTKKTKHNHTFHFFTERDEVALTADGTVHICPMQANPKGIICYLLEGKWFALPLKYRAQLLIK